MQPTVILKPLIRCAALLCAALTLIASVAQAASSGRMPSIYAFNHSGPATINLGETLYLNWSVGDTTELTLTPGIGDVTGTTWVQVTPTETTTYTLTAKNANGTVSRTRTITVVKPPVVETFTATPDAVYAGSSVKLEWAAPGATSYYISSDADIDPGQFIGKNTATIRPKVSSTYTIIARNAAGTSAPRTVAVTVTPLPAKPTLTSFTASPSTVVAGQSTTLAWVVNGATSLSISPGIGAVTGSSVTVAPATTTTYTLTATNAGGTTTKKVSVTVNVATPPPVIASFNASPGTITLGTSSTLAWSVTGATQLEVLASAGTSPGVVTGTSLNVTPSVSTTYTLRATNGSGTVTRTVPVVVTAPAPTIHAFTLSPSPVLLGNPVTLSWTVDDATQLSISPGIGAVTGSSVTITPTADTTYTLTATNGTGSVTRTASVDVTVPAPVIAEFAAAPTAILVGESSTLSWVVQGATSLSITPGIGSVTGTSRVVQPTTTTTYTLSATNEGGTVTRTVQVAVSTPEPLPTIAAFDASPASITPGQSSTLSWSVSGAASVSIAASHGASPGAVTSTSVAVTPAASTAYTLTATNASGGSVTRTINVTVTAPAPVISSFTASPSSISAGASSTLSWSVENAVSLFIAASTLADPGTVTGTSLSVTPAATTVYTLTATNIVGATASSTVTISVTTPPPPSEGAVIESLIATPSNIEAGQSVTLSWVVHNSGSLWMSANRGGDVGSMNGRTSVVVTPTATTSYGLTAWHENGTAFKSVTVTVGPPPPPPVPVIASFTANPSTVVIGSSTQLQWSVSGADSIEISASVGNDPGVVVGNSLTINPTVNTTYTLSATNQHGSVNRTATVTVTGPQAPIVGSFFAEPAFILTGSGLSSTLQWSVSGAESIAIEADAGSAPGPVTGNTATVTPTVTTNYTLVATNTVGTTRVTFPVTFYTGGGGSVAHPRIWITPASLPALRAKAAANDSSWVRLRNQCDQYVTMPIRYPDESNTSGSINGGYQYLDYLQPATALGVAYQTAKTVDPTRAALYGEKLKQLLLILSHPVRHGRPTTDSGYSIRAYVPALALGYDWIYELLSDSDRAQIYTEINRWVASYETTGFGRNFPQGNYFAGYYCGKALGALATEGENPQATAMWDDWLNRVHYGMVQPYHAQFLTGGGAPDGWNYGPFELINMARPIAAAFTAKGLDLIHDARPFTYLDGHANWMTHFTWPDMKTVSDRGFVYESNNPTPSSVAWATQYTGLLRLANGSNTSVMQRYANEIRAIASANDRAEAWAEFLFHEPNAPITDYRNPQVLSYRTVGDGQVAMRSSWQNDAVWATFQSGPYTGYHASSEEFFDKGSLAIQRGDVQFVVNAWGAMMRHTPGTEDGWRIFDPLYTELFGTQTDGVLGGRRIFNTYYAVRANPGYWGQIGNGPDSTTTLSHFEDRQRHVFMRGAHIEDQYWAPHPISGWDRSVIYLRPQLFVVHDRTSVNNASIDNWMAWHIAANPTEQPGAAPGTRRFDAIDTRSAFGGNLFRGRVTTLLPANHTVTSTDVFNKAKVYRLEIRNPVPSTSGTWLTVFDASASAAAAATPAPLTSGMANVLAGNIEGTVITGASGQNHAVLFSKSGTPNTSRIQFVVPAAATYCVLADLTPGANFTATANPVNGVLVIEVTAGGSLTASAQGTLAFDVSATGSVSSP